MTSVLLVILGWLLGAAPLLLVLRASVRRDAARTCELVSNQLKMDKMIEVRHEAELAAAVRDERERIHAVSQTKRAADLKMVEAKVW